jgi:hypothetical protein
MLALSQGRRICVRVSVRCSRGRDPAEGHNPLRSRDIIQFTYFPHDAIVGVINVLREGQAVEVASFGREGMLGLISAVVSREAFGRYKVQVPGSASRIDIRRLLEAMAASPKLR